MFAQLNDQLKNIRYDLYALTSAVQNQPSIDRERFEQDFLAARHQLSGPPFPPETEALLTVLSIRDKASPPRAIAERLRALESARRPPGQPA